MCAMTSQITCVTIVYSTVCSGTDQRKHQNSAALAFVRGIHRWPVNSPHKGPVTRKMIPFDDVIMSLFHMIMDLVLWTTVTWTNHSSLTMPCAPMVFARGKFRWGFLIHLELKCVSDSLHSESASTSSRSFSRMTCAFLCFVQCGMGNPNLFSNDSLNRTKSLRFRGEWLPMNWVQLFMYISRGANITSRTQRPITTRRKSCVKLTRYRLHGEWWKLSKIGNIRISFSCHNDNSSNKSYQRN